VKYEKGNMKRTRRKAGVGRLLNKDNSVTQDQISQRKEEKKEKGKK
jgi:hypothetical protein